MKSNPKNIPDNLDILQNLYTSVIWVDELHIIRWVNTQTEQLLSASQARLIGLNILDILKSIDTNNEELPDNALEPTIELNAKGGKETNLKIDTKQSFNSSNLNIRFNHAKNLQQPFIEYNKYIRGVLAPLCVDYSVTPVEQNSKTYFLIEVWGKSRQSRIDKDFQLQEQHAIAREMLRSVAHEVKNPLAGIRGAAQLLIKLSQTANSSHQHLSQHQIDTPDSNNISNYKGNEASNLKSLTLVDAEKQATYANIVISETDRLTSLIERLLGYHKLPNWQMVNIHQPLEHVLLLTHTQFPNIEIIRDYDLSLPLLEADKDQLIQVFLNLVNNACEAMINQNEMDDSVNSELVMTNKGLEDTPQPTLTLITRVEHQFTIANTTHRQVIKIGIHDNGLGIKPHMIDRIFFPMVSGRSNGSGLGLALVQEMIHQHQGTIEVISEPRDTMFWVYLPLSQHDLQ